MPSTAEPPRPSSHPWASADLRSTPLPGSGFWESGSGKQSRAGATPAAFPSAERLSFQGGGWLSAGRQRAPTVSREVQQAKPLTYLHPKLAPSGPTAVPEESRLHHPPLRTRSRSQRAPSTCVQKRHRVSPCAPRCPPVRTLPPPGPSFACLSSGPTCSQVSVELTKPSHSATAPGRGQQVQGEVMSPPSLHSLSLPPGARLCALSLAAPFPAKCFQNDFPTQRWLKRERLTSTWQLASHTYWTTFGFTENPSCLRGAGREGFKRNKSMAPPTESHEE